MEPLLSITISMSTFGVLWSHWSTMVAAVCAPPVIPDWNGSVRMSVQTRTAPTSSPRVAGAYRMAMGTLVFGCTRTGTVADAVKGPPVVSTRVTVTGKVHWFTAKAGWLRTPQPRMVGPKSTVGGVTKKQLGSP